MDGTKAKPRQAAEEGKVAVVDLPHPLEAGGHEGALHLGEFCQRPGVPGRPHSREERAAYIDAVTANIAD